MIGFLSGTRHTQRLHLLHQGTQRCTLSLKDIHRPQAEILDESEGVLLDVGGMKCGGCSAAVKRILGGRPEVQDLAVNLLTESALVRVKAGTATARAQLAQTYADILTAKV